MPRHPMATLPTFQCDRSTSLSHELEMATDSLIPGGGGGGTLQSRILGWFFGFLGYW